MSAMAWVGWSMSHWRLTSVGFCASTPALMALGDRIHHLMHVGVALADVHIVADADHVRHEGDHVGRLAHGLAVGHLALALVKVLHGQAQQVAPRRRS